MVQEASPLLPKLEPDVLSMGVGLGVGVGEDSMDASGPPSVGSTEAQPVLSNTQTPVSTKKVGFTVTIYFSFFFLVHFYQLYCHMSYIYIFFLLILSFFLFRKICQHTYLFVSLAPFETSLILNKIDRQFLMLSLFCEKREKKAIYCSFTWRNGDNYNLCFLLCLENDG